MARGVEGYKERTITCVHCGATVTRRMPAGRRYCSPECYRTSPKPQRRTGITRSCETCEQPFYLAKSRMAEGRFCSTHCADVWQGRNKTEHTCKICDCTFRWSPSRTASGQYTVTYCSLACRDADPTRRAMLLDMSAQQQLRRMTSAERAGYELLDRLGLPYQRQVVFGGKFTPDALLPASRLVVQFDGDYWHDRKGTSTETRVRRRVALDRSQDAYIRACGWEVVRLWATDLASDPAGCLARVSQAAHRPLLAEPLRAPVVLPSDRT